METKLDRVREDVFDMRLNLGWPFVTNSSIFEKGRIWVTWDNTMLEATTILVHRQVIHLSVRSRDGRFQFYVSFVYASNDSATREALWAELLQLCSGISQPWVVMGDLNCIANLDEKLNFSR